MPNYSFEKVPGCPRETGTNNEHNVSQHTTAKPRIPGGLAVVIPTYNRSNQLRRAIESVLEQTCPADEIIVVDDGSTDDTAEVVESFSKVRLVSKKNGGLSSARNVGIAATECEWVAFLDDDDWYTPDMLTAQERVLKRQPKVDLLYTSFYRVDGTGKVFGVSHKNHRLPKNPLAAMATENFIQPSTVVARRQVLIDAGLFDETVRWAEDVDMWIRLISRHVVMYFVPGPLVYVTKQPGTMSASLSEGTGYYAQGFIDALQRRCYCFEAVDKNGGRQWWLAGAHYRLGRVFWEAGERSSAAAKFREALRCDPWHLGALLYGWATAHPNFARAFRALRLIKRRASRILQRIGVAENRWG